MGKLYVLHVVHTTHGQAICTTCNAYNLRASHICYMQRIRLMDKPYALHVAHRFMGKSYALHICLMVKPDALHVAHMAYGKVICTTYMPYGQAICTTCSSYGL